LIVIDTSAIVAIIKKEAEASDFARILARAEHRYFSAVGLFEASMVLIGRGSLALAGLLDEFVQETMIEIVPYDIDLARESRAAFVRFGRGRHPAGLNFGDCVSYALARSRGLPLLYKGDDFTKTDIVGAAK
jgi:ribonuclease VapC